MLAAGGYFDNVGYNLDHAPRTIRLYELMVGAISAVNAGISATCPAT